MVDFNLDKGNPVVSDDYKMLIHQIDILFDSYKCEVYGDPEFGTEYERDLYDMKLSNGQLASEVRADLNKIDLLGFDVDVKVYLMQGTQQDIALVDISFTRDNEKYNKTYKIL